MLQPARSKHFYLNTSLQAGAVLPIPDELRHRLSGVLRMKEGDTLALFNGQSGLWEAKLTDAKLRKVQVVQQVQPQPTATPMLALALGLPKREAWESALRQATELGVTAIYPLATHYAQRDKVNAERAHAIIIEAAEQCERLTLPVVHPVQTLATWLASLDAPCAWAYERGGDNATPVAPTLFIGPEGGFAPEEVTSLQAHPQIQPFSLGQTILRTDTAVVAGLARLKV